MSESASAAAAAGPPTWPLVGRHGELDHFLDALRRGVRRGLVIHGPAGVGKTRLADECLDVAAGAGRAVGRTTASGSAATVPLGALLHLLPASVLGQRADPVALYRDTASELQRRSDGGAFVLFVDDLHLLDLTSAVLVGQLLEAGVVFLVGTVRTGEPMADAVAALVRRHDVERVDLGELSDEAVDSLLHLALGGPVTADAVDAIRAVSEGNVLFVRELVLGAIAAGRLVERRGVWWLTGPLVGSERLVELVASRIDAVTGPEREVLDLLAVGDPSSLTELESLVGGDVLEALDHQGLISIRRDRRRQEVSLAHPLHGDALRARQPGLRRRRLLLEQAERVEAHGARRREDPLRVAKARLDADGSADPDLLLGAARLSRYGHDHVQVERLARAALTERPTAPARLLLAEALHELGRYGEAEDLLAADTLDESAGPDPDVAALLVSMRVRNLVFGLQRHDEALAVNHAAQRNATSGDIRNDLIADEAIVCCTTIGQRMRWSHSPASGPSATHEPAPWWRSPRCRRSSPPGAPRPRSSPRNGPCASTSSSMSSWPSRTPACTRCTGSMR